MLPLQGLMSPISRCCSSHPHAGADASTQGVLNRAEVAAAPTERLGTKPSVSDFTLVTCCGYSVSLEFPLLTPVRKSGISMPFCINYISPFISSCLWNHIFFWLDVFLRAQWDLWNIFLILSNYGAFCMQLPGKIVSHVCLIWEQVNCLNLHLHAWKSPLGQD